MTRASWLRGRDAAADECDKVAAVLSHYAARYKSEGRDDDMYRSNTAWHNVTGLAERIRNLQPPADLGEG